MLHYWHYDGIVVLIIHPLFRRVDNLLRHSQAKVRAVVSSDLKTFKEISVSRFYVFVGCNIWRTFSHPVATC